MNIDDLIRELRSRFKNTSCTRAISKLARMLKRSSAASHLEAFLRAVELATRDITEKQTLEELFDDTAEQYLCKGVHEYLIRVVTVSGFLSYYSNKFILVETEVRQRRVAKYISKLHAMFGEVSEDNLRHFLDKELELNGRLRRSARPLWLTPQAEVNGCLKFADYQRRLALGLEDSGPAFCIYIGYYHVGVTANVRDGMTGHDPTQTMSLHLPTLLDGMHYPRFRAGGYTAGKAREFVSKLNNTDAIDRLEWIE